MHDNMKRFLLYNICYGAGTGHRLHLPFPYAGHLNRNGKTMDQIIAFLGETEADIIGLVEVDSGSLCADGNSQVSVIARELGYNAVFESKYADTSMANRMPVFKKQGNALLMRSGLPVMGYRYHYFTHGMKRLVIEVELPDMVIFLVHLALKFRIRHHQLTELYHIVKPITKPVVVAGDFNAFRGRRELELFLAAADLQIAGGASAPSYPSRSPRIQLDMICHSPSIQTCGYDIPQVHLSDHAPIVWDFQRVDSLFDCSAYPSHAEEYADVRECVQ